MQFTELRQSFWRELATSVDRQRVPALGTYLPNYVKDGSEVNSEDYRLVPITAASRRFFNTCSDCLTNCMIQLQCKSEQFVPDAWGGRIVRGWRELGVIGFEICPDDALEIREINETACHVQWAKSKSDPLFWERLLIHAVLEFARASGLKSVRLYPAHRSWPPSVLSPSSPESSPEFQQQMKHRYDGSAQALGFRYDEAADTFVLELGAES